MSFKNKTVFISGGTRGIGHAIGMRLAKEGANIVIAAKSTEPHPKLPGTIFSAAADMEKAGGKGLAIKCDIRNEDEVIAAVQKTVENIWWHRYINQQCICNKLIAYFGFGNEKI
jgi:citronellol/citronellal dehydrogenase